MREIKFRGKSLKTDRWVYGYYVHLEDFMRGRETHRIYSGFADSMPGGEGYDFSADYEDVDPDTIGQYTGLNDANGKEIYEGDLLRFPPKIQSEETNYASFEVFFHDGDCCDDHIGFQMNRAHYHGTCNGTTFWPFRPNWVKQMIIDGNIHDNPELIEK